MKKSFYSNGKLLITGEYIVLDGAKAFALPTKFGQWLSVEPSNNHIIKWTSYDNDKSIWFENEILFDDIISNIESSCNIKNTLTKILHEAYILNPDYINKNDGYLVDTNLTFPRNWGLGTSSTLINNIAQWLKIDAFELLQKSFGGSGYDIACAQNNTPIIYQLENKKAIIKNIDFKPNFTNNIYFVYLNQKQNSRSAIASYRKKQCDLKDAIAIVDSITANIINCNDNEIFKNNIKDHENILSNILQLETVKESLFNDFNGEIKSLGAWGGDFILVVSDECPIQYFKNKGYFEVIPYKDMVL